MTLLYKGGGETGIPERRHGLHRSKGTVLDYLREYGNCSFLEKPMNEVDSLVLCQLSYLKFDGLVPDVRENGHFVTLESLESHPGFQGLFADIRFEKVNRELIRRMLEGRRFRNLKLNCYINLVEKQREMQFSALTYVLEDGTLYVAYRGTDESIVGWKEAFNLAFLSPVPGQEYGVEYLKTVVERFRCPCYVGGHSKGGNLAVYSAMNCPAHVYEKIIRIYNWDGPGIRSVMPGNGKYGLIAHKVVKMLPRSGLIGMLFETDMEFQVVESRTFGIAQHDPYTWIVEQDHLVRAKGIRKRCLRIDHILNHWISSLGERKLRTMIDTVYRIISASQADSLIELRQQRKRNLFRMLAAARETDGETVQILRETVKALFIAAGEQRRETAKGVWRSMPAPGHRRWQ